MQVEYEFWKKKKKDSQKYAYRAKDFATLFLRWITFMEKLQWKKKQTKTKTYVYLFRCRV